MMHMPETCTILDELLVKQGLSTAGDTPIDVVYGGAFSIKDYYMESGNPRQMRGASQLLLDAAEEFKKYRYFACGAESFLIVPQGKGEEFARRMEKAFREKTLTAQAAAVYRSTTVGALYDAVAFQSLWRGLNEDFYTRRMLLFLPLERHSGKNRCIRCNFRDRLSGKELCASCDKKDKRGRDTRNTYKRDCLKRNNIIFEETEFKSAQDYADGHGDIALLYGDINDLGWAGKHLGDDVFRRKLFCETVKSTVEESLYAAIPKAVAVSQNNTKSPLAKFEIIAVGGDDICVLLPGNVALLAGTLLLEKFDEFWEARPAGLPMLTISAGIAMGQANTPILYMREAAEQLLKTAKNKAYEEKCSCLDILSLNSDGQWATSIKNLRERELVKTEGNATAKLTMRPFTVHTAHDLLRRLCEYDIHASTLHSIAEASMRCGIAEGDLWFRYMQTRHNDKKLNDLALEYNSDMYYEENGVKISPWHDIAELRGQKGGGSL
jgi:hypothetical protein